MVNKESEMLTLSAVLAEEFTQLHGQKLELPDREEERSAEIFAQIHGLPPAKKRTALCISGGGIRSATFGLGVLQGLASRNFLRRFDYLSTVSGGGYVGSWLTAWIHRRCVVQSAEAAKNALLHVESKLRDPAIEPSELKHLRSHSNYLDPRVGWFSADTWTLVATALRNMLLNWLVLVPLLAGLLVLPRLRAYLVLNGNGVNAWYLHGALVFGALLAIFAIARARAVIPSVQDPVQGKRAFDQNAFLIQVMAPLFASASLISVYRAWHCSPYECPWRGIEPGSQWHVWAVFGSALHLIGWLVWIVHRSGRKQKETASEETYHAAGDFLAVAVSGGVGGALLWVLVNHKPFSEPRSYLYACLATPVLLLVFLLANVLYLGLSSFITSDEDREWWSRAGGWMLIGITVNAVANIMVIYGVYWLLVKAGAWIRSSASVGAISGLITVLLGWGDKTPAREKDKQGSSSGAGSSLLQFALQLAAPVFALFLVLLVAAGTTWLIAETGMAGSLTPANHLDILENTSGIGILGLLSGFLGLAAAMSFFVNVNKFSLHAMYRNRLIRAYLGASRKPEDRHPDRFTGFDLFDNVRMHNLKGQKPFHVVNMALNVAGSPDLSWQERQALSFTASPLHVGSHALRSGQGCYRCSEDYASLPAGRDGKGLSLGSAVTISGAAANPNMGYNSSPLVAFLMTMFNARLGAWLGNPAGKKEHWRRAGPKWAAVPLVAEALALTTSESAYVNLSDGGHFENMALYEMVLRRCSFIMVLDDGKEEDVEKYAFEDLAGAIRKIRIDFGIPIEIDVAPLRKKEAHFVEGVIKYSAVDRLPNGKKVEDGRLVVVKPLLTGDEEVDVFNYARSNPTFPQQSTADQWFNESQFESYRMLGYHSVVGPTQFPLPVSKPEMPLDHWRNSL